VQCWAKEFDTKYYIVRRITSLYDEREIGLLVRKAIYGKKYIKPKELRDIP